QKENFTGIELMFNTTAILGNMTLWAYGNTRLQDIQFSIIDIPGDEFLAMQYLTFSPSSVSIINKSEKTNVTVCTKIDGSLGLYTSHIRSSDTTSTCIPTANCYDDTEVNITLFGRAAALMTSPSSGEHERGNLALTCKTYDFDTDAIIPTYNTSLFYNSSLLVTNTTNTTGETMYVWNTESIEPGNYNLNCTIADNLAIYYKANISSSVTNINLTGNLSIDNFSASKDTLYWYDSHSDSATNFTVHVSDEFQNNVSGATVHFYSNATLDASFAEVSNCTTLSNGFCTGAWNPSIQGIVNATIHYNATKGAYFYASGTNTTHINILGNFSIFIIIPDSLESNNSKDTKFINYTSQILNVSVLSGEGNEVDPDSINWSFDGADIGLNNKSGYLFVNTSYGKHNLSVSALNNTEWVNDTIEVTVYDYARINITYSSGTTFPRTGSIVNFS
ncbi:MAG: hypothetical protein KAJ24_00210, partial [Candidatus Aenigmarchaeota archaeon]|nr:hypothetical protein [Candidatus Aenigmarchaeota archaeon]